MPSALLSCSRRSCTIALAALRVDTRLPGKLPPRRSLEVPLETIPNASLGSPKTITNKRALTSVRANRYHDLLCFHASLPFDEDNATAVATFNLKAVGCGYGLAKGPGSGRRLSCWVGAVSGPGSRRKTHR